MKEKFTVVVAFPPLYSDKGIALLSQNRQFQWSKSRTIVYPVIPASAATLLQSKGYVVKWLDGIAEGWTFKEWLDKLASHNPDLIFLETKTPVIKKHWQIIKKIKKRLPKIIVVLAGDHISAFPEESLKSSLTDYVLVGGNYDALLLNLVDHFTKKRPIKERLLTGGKVDLNKLPFIDRKLTKWQLYASKNGNFKHFPGTYIMAGRDCWWRKLGGCSFCSWTSIFPQFSFRTVDNVLDEIGQLIELGVKEIFDDTGTFLVGDWLRQFCQGMIDRGYHKKIVMGCNMRFGYLNEGDYILMAKAGFRFILYGLESANQETLDKLNKGTQIQKVEKELVSIKQANKKTCGHIEPHVTCMVGYPWETKAEAQETVNFCKKLFQKGLINSLQATIMIPYPGTKLFNEADKNGWLLTKNWDDYDMKMPVLKTDLTPLEIGRLTQKIYLSALTPRFIWKTLSSIRSAQDIRVFAINSYKYLARFIDFRPQSK